MSEKTVLLEYLMREFSLIITSIDIHDILNIKNG